MEKNENLFTKKKESLNIEDQIASMLENVMNDHSEDSEEEIKENETEDFCDLRNGQINFSIKKRIDNNFNEFESPNFNFKNEFDCDYFKNNLNNNDYGNFNPNFLRRDKKFHSNNHLDSRSLHNEVIFNINDFQSSKKFNQTKLFMKNVGVCYQNENENLSVNRRENDPRISQNFINFKQNNNFNNTNSSMSSNNINNFNISNGFNNNNFVNEKYLNPKSQSSKTNNLFYKPLTLSPKMLKNNNTKINYQFKHFSNNSIIPNRNNCFNNNNQNLKFTNFHNFNNSLNQNNIFNNNPNVKYGSDQCMNNLSKDFKNNSNKFLNHNYNKGSSTNATFSHCSVMNSSNEQNIYSKKDENSSN